MMNGSFDPKKKVLQELMGYLNKKDDDSLSEAMKPKDMAIEVTKVEGMGGEEESPEVDAVLAEGAPEEPSMSPEELDELIEAIQSKLG